ncbi:MAG: hypothetical protein R3F30_04580 [Planctomycetota bacterium]
MIRLQAPVLYALLAAAPLAAQAGDGPYWNEYPLPAGTTTYQALGTLFWLQAPNAVHLYSGLHRKWTVQKTGASPTLYTTNSYCVIQDGTTVHGYSTRTGAVDTIQVSSTATVDIGSATSSWVVVVNDGTTAYGFSGFFGKWVPLKLAAKAVSTDMSSHIGLVYDGTQAHAFSAFHGTWVSRKVKAPTAKHVFRSGALLGQAGPDEVLAFSTYSNTWSALAWSGAATATPELQDGYALLVDGKNVLSFDAIHGGLGSRTEPETPQVLAARNVCVLTSSSQTACYAPGTDTWVTTTAPVPAGNVHVASGSIAAIAVLDTGKGYLGFSGLTGKLTAAPSTGPFTLTLGDTAAFAQAVSTSSYGYSGILDKWVVAPMVGLNNVHQTFNGIILATSTGYEGFSARLGTWSSLTASGGTLVTQTSGALTCVVTSSKVDAFDSTIGKWVTQGTAGAANLSIWRLCGIAVDQVRAYGYSLFHNTWESLDFKGTYVAHKANSSLGYVVTSTHAYVFTANGSLSNYSRFPEFSRFAPRGLPFAYLQAGQPGSFVVGLLGVGHMELDASPFGKLWMDPTAMIALPLAAIPADGMLRINLLPPADLSFNGTTVIMQSLVVPTSGAPFLSNAMRPIFF